MRKIRIGAERTATGSVATVEAVSHFVGEFGVPRGQRGYWATMRGYYRHLISLERFLDR